MVLGIIAPNVDVRHMDSYFPSSLCVVRYIGHLILGRHRLSLLLRTESVSPILVPGPSLIPSTLLQLDLWVHREIS